jgi:hypothetical protein
MFCKDGMSAAHRRRGTLSALKDRILRRLETLSPSLFVSFLLLSLCGFLPCGSSALNAEPSAQPPRAGAPIQIVVQDKEGNRIAGPGSIGSSVSYSRSSRENSAVLVFDREYRPGDRIVIRGPRRMAVKLDGAMDECFLYNSESADGGWTYEIPAGSNEQDTGSACAPTSFAGTSHRISVRALSGKEISEYRNLALNPCDQQVQGEAPESASLAVFPHASSNSVFRNWPDFRERNAIDGKAENGHHGKWPYQSWGPEKREDLWWKLDFGRAVDINRIRLMVRADFPHDSYWKSAVVEFSDGTRLPIQIAPSADFQVFAFARRRVSWLRVTHMVAADPDRWCGFVEVEVSGRDVYRGRANEY